MNVYMCKSVLIYCPPSFCLEVIRCTCTCLQTLDRESCMYSHVDRPWGLAGGVEGRAALMKVWLIVLTIIPYSSTSARRESKNACTACFEAESEITHAHTHTHKQDATHPLLRLIPYVAEEILCLIIILNCTVQESCASDYENYKSFFESATGFLSHTCNRGICNASIQEVLKGIASLPWMLLTNRMWPDLLDIIAGRTPATSINQ